MAVAVAVALTVVVTVTVGESIAARRPAAPGFAQHPASRSEKAPSSKRSPKP
jgi:hypothetical protein